VKQITAVFDSVDSDKDDKITAEQFAEAMEKLKGMWCVRTEYPQRSKKELLLLPTLLDK